MNPNNTHINHSPSSFILNLLLQVYCVLLPFEEAFAGSFGSVVKLVGLAVVGYALVAYRKFTFTRVNGWLVAWLALGGLSIGWAESLHWWKSFYPIYVSQVLFLIVLTGLPVGAIDLGRVRRGLIAGAVITSLLLILYPQNFAFTEDGRRTVVLLERSFDPNILAGVVLLGIFSSLQNLFGAYTRYKRWGLFVIIFVCLGGVFYTGSRGGLLGCIIGGSMALLLEFKIHQNRKLASRFVVLGGILLLLLLPHLSTNLLEGRYSAAHILGFDEVQTGSHNRYFIWASALKLIPQHPLLGYGVGNFISSIATVYNRSCAAHNLFVLVIVETGIVGLLCMGIFLWKLLCTLYRATAYIPLGMFVGVLVLSLTLDAIPYKFFWVAVLYAQLTIRNMTLTSSKEQEK